MYEIVIVLVVLTILFSLIALSYKLIKSQASDLLMQGLASKDSLERNAYLRKAALLCSRPLKRLGIRTDDAVIVFMPCSNDVRFTKKFQHLCWKLQKKGYEANHMTYPYLSVRSQKDDSSSAENLMSHVRQIVGVENRKVIVVDDVFNTGKTLKAFGVELKKYHSQIVGAVFVSKVFYPPKSSLLAWFKIALT